MKRTETMRSNINIFKRGIFLTDPVVLTAFAYAKLMSMAHKEKKNVF